MFGGSFNPFIFINKKCRDISLTVFTVLKHMNSSAGIRDLGMAIIFISRRSKSGEWGGPGRAGDSRPLRPVPVRLMDGGGGG